MTKRTVIFEGTLWKRVTLGRCNWMLGGEEFLKEIINYMEPWMYLVTGESVHDTFGNYRVTVEIERLKDDQST
jgi:hypothetical protein